MTRTAYVTGSTGFLGLNLVEELVGQGWRVIALHRHGSDITYLQRFPVELRIGDITDPASLANSIPKGIDAVFHVAGNTDLWSRRNALQDNVNILGTRNVLEAAISAGATRFIHTSSNAAYGMQSGVISESTAQKGGESSVNYQRSKFLAEVEVRKAVTKGLHAIILNPAAILGPHITGGYARFFQLVASGKLLAAPPGALSFCHSREVAKALITAVERGRKGENYLLGGANASILQLARTISALAGRSTPIMRMPGWILKTGAFVAYGASTITRKAPLLTPEAARLITRSFFCDCAKAKRELGYKPVTLESMAEDCYKWLSQECLL
jgi:dihydroflavonol-4-reductase